MRRARSQHVVLATTLVSWLAASLVRADLLSLPAHLEIGTTNSSDRAYEFRLTNMGDAPITWTFLGADEGPGWLDATLDRVWHSPFPDPSTSDDFFASVPDSFFFNANDDQDTITAARAPDLYGVGGGNRFRVAGEEIGYGDDGVNYVTATVGGNGLFVWGCEFTGTADAGTALATYGELSPPPVGRGVSASSFSVVAGGRTYFAFVKSVHGGGDPALNHLWLVESETPPTHTFSADPAEDIDMLSGFSRGDRVYLIVFSTKADTAPSNPSLEPPAMVFARHVAPAPIALEPVSGTIPPGGLQNVVATVGSSGLRTDWTQARLRALLFDDGEGELSVPADITVYAAWNMSIVAGSLNTLSGTEFEAREVHLSHRDGVPLPVNITSPVPWISVSPQSGTLPFTVTLSGDASAAPLGAVSTVLTAELGRGQSRDFGVSTNVEEPRFHQLVAAPGDPFVYAAHNNAVPGGQDYIVRVDPHTASLESILARPRGGVQIALDPGENLYLLNGGEIVVLGLGGLPVNRRSELGLFDPRGIAAGAGDSVVVYHYRSIEWYDSTTFASISEVDVSQAGHMAGWGGDGAIFFANLRGSSLQRMPSDRFGSLLRRSFGASSSEGPFVVSAQAKRVFFSDRVFDENLNSLGTLPEAVIACSPRGELAVTATGVRRLSTGGDLVMSFPFPATAAAVWGDAERVIVHDSDMSQTVSLPLRDYAVTAADFGAAELGVTDMVAVTVTNFGVEPLTLTGATDGEVTLSPFPTTVAPGGSAILNATFSPSAEGATAGAVTLFDDFIEGPTRTVEFTAEGVFDPATLPGYADWRATHFAQNPSPGDPLADPDRDRYPNFAEFLFGLDPNLAGDPSGHLPAIVDGQLSYVRRTTSADHISLEHSIDLTAWETAPPHPETTSDLGNGIERVIVDLPVSGGFYRAAARLAVGG